MQIPARKENERIKISYPCSQQQQQLQDIQTFWQLSGIWCNILLSMYSYKNKPHNTIDCIIKVIRIVLFFFTNNTLENFLYKFRVLKLMVKSKFCHFLEILSD